MDEKSSQGKRSRADSIARRLPAQRPRAVDIPQPVRAAPASWTTLTTQIQYAWTYNAAVAKIIRDGAGSMRSEDLSSRIVTQIRANPVPRFKFIRKNTRPRQTPATVNHVYKIFPMILTSCNAQESPDPPFNLNPDGSTVLPSLDSFAPSVISTEPNNQYQPLHRQPKLAEINNAAQLSNRSFVVEDSIRAQIRADYIRFHERDMAFAQDMSRLQIIAPQNLNRVRIENEHTVPHSLLTQMYALMHEKIIRHLLNTEFADTTSVMAALNNFYERLASATACSDAILLRALDACAIIGGIELPRWPPNKEWRGAVIDFKSLPKLGIEPTEDEQQLLATVRRLERWGVPIWSFSVSSANSRFDVTPDGLPSEDDIEEGVFQNMLLLILRGVQGTKSLKLVARVHADDASNTTCSGLPTGSERHRLQHAVVALLDHNSPHHMSFMHFSAIAQDILGRRVWTGIPYEAALHPVSFTVFQPMPWNRVRDAIRECGHCGVNIALFQIPLPWINPRCSVATMAGQYASTEQVVARSLVASSRGAWFVLEVDDFTMKDRLVVHQLAERFAPDGLYGWSFVQSGLQKKDAKGKSIPRSRFTARLLFKQQHVREHVENCIAADFSNHEQRSKDEVDMGDDVLFTYSFLVHPHFVNITYGEPISPMSRSQVMALAPPFDVIPASVGKPERAMQVKQVIHSLRYFELFEIKKFPPHIAPPIAPSSHVPLPPRTGLDMSSCTLEVLLQLASSALPNNELSFMDVCRMRRFAYLMEILAKDGQFMCQVFRSNGPYLRILRYLSTTIRDTHPAGSSFSPRSNRVDVGPFREAVRMTPFRRVEIILNLNVSESNIQLPTEAEMVRWNENVAKMWHDFSRKRSRSERRHDKERRRIAHGIAVGMAGPPH